MNHALIEIGSNSIKFYMIDNKKNILFDENSITKLGKSLNKENLLSTESMKLSLKVIKKYYNKAIKYNASKIDIIATMALRKAKNSLEFSKKVKNITSIDLEIISGEKEAQLSYLATISSIKNLPQNFIIFDTGGGSTEFIFVYNKNISKKISIDIGSVTLTENYLNNINIVDKEILGLLKKYIKKTLKYSLNLKNKEYKTLIGIGGTVTTISAINHKMEKYDSEIINNSKISLKEINKQIKLFSNFTLKEREKIIGLQPKRADIILAGALIVETILEIFNIDQLIVSDRGLRQGFFVNR